MILCFILIIIFFRKPTRPSLPLRKAPPLISVFSPQGRRGKPPSGAQNRCAIRLADHQRSSPDFAGWDRMEIDGGAYRISVGKFCPNRFVVIFIGFLLP